MVTMGERLRFERQRLKLTQAAMASACDVQPNAQLLYEGNKRGPRADYLIGAGKLGVDLRYVLSGQRAPEAGQFLLPNEAELLRSMRRLAGEDLQALHHVICRLGVLQAEASQ